MKTWIKRTLIGLFGATVLFGGLAACSHRAHHGMAWQQMSDEEAAKLKAKLVDRVGSRLDLDAAQKAKLGIVADQFRAQRQALVGASDPRAELAAVIAGPTFDREKAQSLVSAKTQALQSRSPELLAAMADFYDSLKPEQQAKVREFLAQRGRRGGWHG